MRTLVSNIFKHPKILVGMGIFLVVVLSCFGRVRDGGADALLYRGLGANLITDVGYQDTVRNGENLPPVGHPAIIAAFLKIGADNGMLFSRVLLGLGLLFYFMTLIRLGCPAFRTVAALILARVALPNSTQWGVEYSIIFSTSLLGFSLVSFLEKKSWSWALAFGCALILNLLVRPLLLPFFYFSIVFVMTAALCKNRLAVKLASSLILVLLVFQLIGSLSKAHFGDERLTRGTYAEIPLYVAFNPCIDLEKPYYSRLWNEISESQSHECKAMMSLGEGGLADRSLRLRRAVIDFIKSYPDKALSAFLWRLKIYTFGSKNVSYLIFFLIWMTLAAMSIPAVFRKLGNRHISPQLIWLVLVPYSLGLVSMFPFVGNRYYAFPAIILIYCTTLLLYYRNQSRLQKD